MCSGSMLLLTSPPCRISGRGLEETYQAFVLEAVLPRSISGEVYKQREASTRPDLLNSFRSPAILTRRKLTRCLILDALLRRLLTTRFTGTVCPSRQEGLASWYLILEEEIDL